MPTSATGTDPRSTSGFLQHTATRRESRQSGFTLVELIVVLAIMTLVAGTVAFAYPRFHDAMQYREAVRGVISGLHRARTDALRANAQAVFFIDLGSRNYGVNQRVLGAFPDSLDLRFIVAQREIRAEQRGGIRFYADGASTGGSIDLVRQNGAGVRVRVDWLLGRITQEVLQ